MVETPAAKSVKAYETEAKDAEFTSDPRELTIDFLLLGLIGEGGSLVSELKKKQRDKNSYYGYTGSVVEELGDALWYLSALCNRVERPLSNVAGALASKSPEIVTFADLQPATKPKQDEPTPEFEATLLQLSSAIGSLIETARTESSTFESAAGLVLRLMLQAASEAGVTLEEAAQANLNKTQDRWPKTRVYPSPLPDCAVPIYEQLPRQLTIDVIEVKGSKTFVYQRYGSINIGDRLTDNIEKPDDYRFHDVFHYAYAAKFGWSPVLRALLKAKRKSTDDDEQQDGARAVLLEEGLAAWIFSQAEPLKFFEDVEPGTLSFTLLKNARRFVKGYEPARLPLWLWEEAILEGFAAFRFLKKNRSGRLSLDLDTRQISIAPIA